MSRMCEDAFTTSRSTHEKMEGNQLNDETPWQMLSIMVMNDCVPIAVTVAKWSVNNTSRKLNTALSYLGNC